MKLYIFILYIYSISWSLSELPPERVEIDNLEFILNEFIGEMLERYFINENCLAIIGNRYLTTRFNLTVNFLRFGIEGGDGLDHCVKEIRSFLLFASAHNCSSYIVISKEVTCFWDGYEWARNNSIVRHQPKFLFLPEHFDQNLTDDLFSNKNTKFWPHIIGADLRNQSDDNITRLLLYTNDFHSRDNYNKIFLDEWSYDEGFIYKNELYFDKIADLQGKVIRVSTFTYPPYTMFDPLDGFEGGLIVEFCKIHNCTTKTVSDEGHLWGAVYSNLTGNGILGQILTDRSDVGAAALPISPWENSVLDFSSAYFSSIVTCLVPKPKQLPYWMVPFMPFDLKMWLALLASLLIAAISLRIVTRIAFLHTRFGPELKVKGQFFSVGDSIIRSIGLVLAQSPSSRMVGDSPNKHLFTSFEILFLFFTACYCAGLEAYLTVPVYYPAIDSLDELISSNLKWLAEHEAFLYCLLYDTDPKIVDLVNRAVIKPSDELLKLGLTGEYAIALEILPDGSSPDRDHLSEQVISLSHLMRGRLYDSPVATAFQKGSPYLPRFNSMVHSFMDTGILFFMITDAARNFLSHGKQSALKQSRVIHDPPEPKVLKLEHIQGAFNLFLGGLLLSIVIFIIERLAFKKVKKGKKNPFAIID